MTDPRHVHLSKFLSLVLRHQPETIGLVLDAGGWAAIDELIARSRAHGTPFTEDELLAVVAGSDKQRFSLSEDRRRIRAAQGHSIPVELGLAPTPPPATLYHGTATRFVPSIRTQGLVPGARQHVHLSPDAATAHKVGQRHGRPVVLVIDAAAMAAQGHTFYLSANGVWLTDHVPPAFIGPDDASSSATDSATTSRHPKPSR